MYVTACKAAGGVRTQKFYQCYEHTSKELERAAGDMIVNPMKKFIPESKTESPVDKKPDPVVAVPSTPGFSGNMSNCTINLNINYGKPI